MPKYKIKNTNILHNGVVKKIGDVIELTKEQAKRLEDILIPVQEPAQPKSNGNKNPKDKTPKEPEEKTNTNANETGDKQ